MKSVARSNNARTRVISWRSSRRRTGGQEKETSPSEGREEKSGGFRETGSK